MLKYNYISIILFKKKLKFAIFTIAIAISTYLAT